MRHREHRMHAHSLRAYASSDFSDRERAIIHCLGESAVPLTAREIAGRLGYADLNAVRPRLTELLEDHIVAEATRVRCPVTGKTVSTFAIAVPVQQALA